MDCANFVHHKVVGFLKCLGRYHKAMLEQAKVRYPDDTCAIRFMEYCLIDIDGDGKAEVWVTSPHRGTVPL